MLYTITQRLYGAKVFNLGLCRKYHNDYGNENTVFSYSLYYNIESAESGIFETC